MNWDQVKIVAVKEMREITSSKGTIISTVFFALWFGLLNGQTTAGETSDMLSKQLFFMAPMLGALMGYLLTGTVFSNEKKDGVIETLLCTPLDLRTIWFGKLVGVSVIAYLASLVSITFVILLASTAANALVLPSLDHPRAHRRHRAAVHRRGCGTDRLFPAAPGNEGEHGHRDIHFPGPVHRHSRGGAAIERFRNDHRAMLLVLFLVAAGLLAFTFYLARFLSKEKVITTIP